MDGRSLIEVIDVVRAKHNIPFNLKKEQLDILSASLKKRNCLGLLPTGYGKSVCYWMLPLILDELYQTDERHIVLVISSLNSLMQDQVTFLQKHNIPAISLNLCTDEERKDIVNGGFSVIFASPEVAIQSAMVKIWQNPLYKQRLCLFACDEAHCISEWGLDFRPDFRELGLLRSIIQAPVVALSATVTEAIRADIFRYLVLDESTTDIVSVIPDRPNVYLHLEKSPCDAEKVFSPLVSHMKAHRKNSLKTIIYCRSIDATIDVFSSIMDDLDDAGYDGERVVENRMVEMFHASSDVYTKDRILKDFTSDESTIRYLVATLAFGMGIQVNSVSTIIHWGAPRHAISYWQEVGRCARDGKQGNAITLAYGRSLIKNKTDDKVIYLYDNLGVLCIRKLVLSDFCISGVDQSSLSTMGICSCSPDICRPDSCSCNCKYCCTSCSMKCPCAVYKDGLKLGSIYTI